MWRHPPPPLRDYELVAVEGSVSVLLPGGALVKLVSEISFLNNWIFGLFLLPSRSTHSSILPLARMPASFIVWQN